MFWWIAMGLGWGADRQVLLMGNSYTAFNDLSGRLESAQRARPPWADAEVRALTEGGFTWADHVERTAETGPWADALTTGWDAVVLQEQSQIPGFDPGSAVWQTSAASLDALEAAVAPAPVTLFLTWGRRDGDPQNRERYPDFITMQDLLTAGIAAHVEAGSGRTVAPVGEVFRRLHDEDADGLFRRLYNDDGSHPSGLGTWVAAATLHATLTGHDPLEVPAPSDPAVDVLAAAVRSVVLDDPFAGLPLPFARDWDASTEEGQIGHPAVREVVRLATPASAATVHLGGREGDGAEGELWLAEGAALSATVRVGPGGQLTVQPDAGPLQGDLEQVGGTLRLATVPWSVEGAYTAAAGELVVDRPLNDGDVLVDALQVDLGSVNGPANGRFRVRRHSGREHLVWQEAGSCACGGPARLAGGWLLAGLLAVVARRRQDRVG